MQSVDLVRDSIACMCRAHCGDFWQGSERSWLARQTRALFPITRRVGRAGLTEQYHRQHRLQHHVRRVVMPSDVQPWPALTANLARFRYLLDHVVERRRFAPTTPVVRRTVVQRMEAAHWLLHDDPS
jgi:hypothetical protein